MTRLMTFRAPLLCLALALFNAASPEAAFSQAINAPAAAKVVKDVRVVFNGPASISEARVRAQMALREGEAYSKEIEDQDLRNLYATGAVDNVTITATEVSGGVSVTVTVTGRGAIGDIVFQGNTQVDSKKLAKDIELKTGEPVDEVRIAAGSQKIRERYEKQGFAEVSVSYQTEVIADTGFTRVVFIVNEGARGLVRNINFEGNSVMKASELRAKMTLKEKALWRVWRGKAARISDEVLNEDVKKVEGVYQDAGYVYAKVAEVRREPVGDDYVDLTFVVVEGEKYDVGDVTLEGITVFTAEELRPALRTISGFAYAGSDVTADEKMVGDYYGSRGYADARVDTSIIPAGPGKVNVIFRVSEGAKSFIRKVNIAGNDVTQDQVIRRELPFTPGEELNTVKIDAGKRRLQQLGYFSEVDIRNNATEQEGFKDVDVTVAEQSTGTINFGAGFSSIDSLVGFIDLTQTNFDIGGWPNFRGAGQRFHMGLKYGTKRRDFSMAFTEPWFLGQKLSFTTELFYRDQYYLSDVYDQQTYGLSFNFRKPLGEHAYIEAGYTLQNIKIHDVDEDASDIIKAEEGDYLQSKIDLSWVHDTRDDLYITRSGHKLEVGGLVSGNFLGGDADVYGINITGSQYFSLPFDTILSVEGSVRAVDSFDDSVPIFERVFLGGANNLRGFDYREVGPKDENGEPIGGLTSAYASVEYSAPVIEKVRAAVFYDVGTVSVDSFDVGGGDLNSNIGIGLRLYLPAIGAIRLDYGIPVQADERNDSSGQFNFNLGYKF
jgi:outer membrane protein insertion porin family